MGTLYVVATPIGNLEDITLRALRILSEVGLILAEDTRTTRKLLARYDIHIPMLSYTEHNSSSRITRVIEELRAKDVALVSEAGMPTVSDPGASLIRAVVLNGAVVNSIPGPSAVTAAVALSGISGDSFTFVGFLPKHREDRLNQLLSFVHESRTIVIFEAPHRLRATLTDLLNTLGDRVIAVCREMTKLHEELFHGLLSKAIEHFTLPRGEFVLVITGTKKNASLKKYDLDEVQSELARLRSLGTKGRDAVDKVSVIYKMSRREAYRLWVELTGP